MPKPKQSDEPTPREQAEFIQQTIEDDRIPDFVMTAIILTFQEAARRLHKDGYRSDDNREQDIQFYESVISAGGRMFNMRNSPADEIAFHIAALLKLRETPAVVKAALRGAVGAMGNGFDSPNVLASIVTQHNADREADVARREYVAEIDDALRELATKDESETAQPS